ncbi:MAG: hypothetical protein H6923_08465 [Alphaproteobacteria bacterium]|nr:hypothetical protein [Alphaproteobacteria bacterium]
MDELKLTRDADRLLAFVYDRAGGEVDVEVDATAFLERADWTEAHYQHVLAYLERLGWGRRIETSLPLHDGTQRESEIDEGEAWPDVPLHHSRNLALTGEGLARIDAQRK